MTRRALTGGLAAGAATALTATAVFAIAAQTGGGRPDLLAFSNRGTAVAPTGHVAAVLDRTGTGNGSLRVLGREGGATFYKVVDSARGACYGTGAGDGADAQLNTMVCSEASFPSAADPVLDVSVVEEAVATGQRRLDLVQGFAADGVVTITAATSDGAVVARAPVHNNLYRIGRESLTGDATTLIGRDRAGAVVFRRVF